MTTPTIDQMYLHCSVRQYRPDPVSIEHIETIVAAARRGSTSSNLQVYSVVAVTGVAKRAHLASLCGNQDHILQAPVFIAWCADLSRMNWVCGARGYE
jgi:nitroreductase